ncbi:hypothetical protein [Paenibacillus farraposensis]|nr:hypothetical protein [Paenibacillus farraposensis]
MRKRGIKVLEQHELEDGITAKYLCRGYVHVARILWGKVKSDTEVRLVAYLGVDISEIQRS